MESTDVTAVWAKLVTDGVADRAEQEAAVAALAETPERWQDLLADLEMDGLLRRAFGDEDPDEAESFVRGFRGRLEAEQDGEVFVSRMKHRVVNEPRSRVPGRSSRRLVLTLAGMTTVSAALIAVAWRGHRSATLSAQDRSGPAGETAEPRLGEPGLEAAGVARRPIARVTKVEGTVWVLDGAKRESTRDEGPILSGQGLLTIGDRSAARVVYQDGTAIDVGGGAVVPSLSQADAPAPRTVFVAIGAVRLETAPAAAEVGPSMVVVTPHGESLLDRGRFSVSVSPRATTLEVLEGSAQSRRAPSDAPVSLVAGQKAMLSPERSALTVGAASTPRTATLVVGPIPPGDGDKLLEKRLGDLGFDVAVVPSAGIEDSDGPFGRLVVVSASAETLEVNTRFRRATVPVIILEPYLGPDMGMTGARHHREAGEFHLADGTIRIRQPGHPLAGGLSGDVRIFPGRTQVGWGVPSPFATSVATVADGERSVMFGYEAGAQMAGIIAPAPRIGFFVEEATSLTESGWQLFDAAVRWCTDERRKP